MILYTQFQLLQDMKTVKGDQILKDNSVEQLSPQLPFDIDLQTHKDHSILLTYFLILKIQYIPEFFLPRLKLKFINK